MTEEKMCPVHVRMLEYIRIRWMGDKARKSHTRAIRNFAAFPGHSPDTTTPEELRAYQLNMTDGGVTPSTFTTRIVAVWGILWEDRFWRVATVSGSSAWASRISMDVAKAGQLIGSLITLGS